MHSIVAVGRRDPLLNQITFVSKWVFVQEVSHRIHNTIVFKAISIEDVVVSARRRVYDSQNPESGVSWVQRGREEVKSTAPAGQLRFQAPFPDGQCQLHRIENAAALKVL